nr:OST-HTH/LOTUS domain-containing protein [uncultured Albidiferax sp.]
MSKAPYQLETPAHPDDVPSLQREVQRLLGSCLLRLQQYERLLKAIVAHHELAGPAHSLEGIRDARIQDAATKTLGTLIGKFLDSYIVTDRVERELLGDNTPDDVISFGFRMNIQMTEEDYAHTRDGLKELVDLRNGLVHHFIEQHDLQQADGCIKARDHLLTSYSRIDEHYEQLRAWAENMDQARQLAASIMQSPTYHDFVVNGIAPDGTVDWGTAGCVSALREAVAALAIDGWTSVAAATTWISAQHPDQTPEQYGCRTWRQVINESRRFDLRYREDGGLKAAWYRKRSNVAKVSR